MPPVTRAFETISLAKVATSAAEARELGFLGPDDGITMNRDRLLADAKTKALELAEGYRPPEPAVLNLPGPGGKAALDMAIQGFRLQGRATAHDAVVGEVLAGVLSGGATDPLDEIDEAGVLALERSGFMRLLREPATQSRIEHMLETGKPLRN